MLDTEKSNQFDASANDACDLAWGVVGADGRESERGTGLIWEVLNLSEAIP
jgi:hypothetical protein